MNRTYRTLAALGAATALTVGGLAPASAERWSHHDAVGDVMSDTYSWEDDGNSESTYVPDPDNRNADITKLRVRHGTHRLDLRMSLRDIDAASGFALYTLRADGRGFMVMQRLGRVEGMPRVALMRGNGKPVRCHGVRHEVDRQIERARLNIPRRCLSRPAWVRVGAAAVAWKDVRETTTDWWDDAMSEGEGDLFAMSPRVKRD